jgi:hypothetical protein
MHETMIAINRQSYAQREIHTLSPEVFPPLMNFESLEK